MARLVTRDPLDVDLALDRDWSEPSTHTPRHRRAGASPTLVELESTGALLDFVPQQPDRREWPRPAAAPLPGEPPPLSPPVAATMPPTNDGDRWSLRGLIVPLLVLALAAQSAWMIWALRESSANQVSAAVSAVTITSEPEGAEVIVDGAVLGTTPFTGDLPVGAHQLQVGEQPVRPLVVQAGASAAMHVVLPPVEAVPDTATVEIATEPAGAAITVDGVPRGTSPLRLDDLPPGAHEVTLARAGRVMRRLITVSAGTPTSLVVTMDGGGAATGWLRVTSPVPAQIYADGLLVGRTDAPRTPLTAGRHELVFVNEALNFREEHSVVVGGGRTVAVTLSPVTGTIHVNAQPWASVWIDGTAVGDTPIGNYTVPIGTHEVILRHPDLGERRQMVTVGIGAPARVGVDLRR
jgi:hypothetical protein